MTRTKLRQLEILFLVCISIVGGMYALDFGLILTAYPHGGQLLGVPFAVVLIVYCSLIVFSRSPTTRAVFRIINYCYFSTMLSYLCTVKLIQHLKGETAWEYLHGFNPPELTRNEKIFFAHAIGGVLICTMLLFLRWWRSVRPKAE